MNLDALRQRIDRIDEKLVRLLDERAQLAQRIGVEKRKQGLPVVDAAREDAVLRRVRDLTRGPLSRAALAGIYRAIVAACARIQREQ
jgi:chorismate mutase